MSAPKQVALGVAIALLSSTAAPVRAEEPADGVFGSFTHESLTYTQTVLTETGSRTPTFGAREEVRYRRGRLQLAVRLDFAAEKSGVDIEDPATYTSIEAVGLASYRVFGKVALAGVWGMSRPSIGVPGPTRETWMAGPLIGTSERWVLLAVGRREALGSGLSAGVAWRLHLDGRTSTVGDAVGAMRDGRLVYVIRAGAAVSVFGEP